MLLVVDVPSWDNYRLAKILKANLTNLQPNDAPLDVMAFVDTGLRELEDQIRVLWKGPLNFLCASKYLDKVGLTVRRYACCFTADLRERLEGIAAEVGGNARAKRFGELWWYTETSEKNSPATPPWWDLLRLEAIRARLKEISPGCSLVGLMLKLKLQYFGHLTRRADSFEKILQRAATKVVFPAPDEVPWIISDFEILNSPQCFY